MTKHWVIADENGKFYNWEYEGSWWMPKVSKKPETYFYKSQAMDKAKRLVSKFNKQFVVLEAVAVASVPVTITEL